MHRERERERERASISIQRVFKKGIRQMFISYSDCENVIRSRNVVFRMRNTHTHIHAHTYTNTHTYIHTHTNTHSGDRGILQVY